MGRQTTILVGLTPYGQLRVVFGLWEEVKKRVPVAKLHRLWENIQNSTQKDSRWQSNLQPSCCVVTVLSLFTITTSWVSAQNPQFQNLQRATSSKSLQGCFVNLLKCSVTFFQFSIFTHESPFWLKEKMCVRSLLREKPSGSMWVSLGTDSGSVSPTSRPLISTAALAVRIMRDCGSRLIKALSLTHSHLLPSDCNSSYEHSAVPLSDSCRFLLFGKNRSSAVCEGLTRPKNVTWMFLLCTFFYFIVTKKGNCGI